MLVALLFAALIAEPETTTVPSLDTPTDQESEVIVGVHVPPPGAVWRLRAGEDDVSREGDAYRAGTSSTEAALPEGYPAPTAPGAIEIKSYPSVRRAQISGDGQNAGARQGFWPLFQHIQQNDIAMTAPVEMIYDGVTNADESSDHTVEDGSDWTMSFLYRTVANGPTGTDGNVQIIDAAPVTVLSVGVRGGLRGTVIREQAGELMAWIEDSDDWEIAGDLRTFGYNGPSVPNARKWWEVQIPIRPMATGDGLQRPL